MNPKVKSKLKEEAQTAQKRTVSHRHPKKSFCLSPRAVAYNTIRRGLELTAVLLLLYLQIKLGNSNGWT